MSATPEQSVATPSPINLDFQGVKIESIHIEEAFKWDEELDGEEEGGEPVGQASGEEMQPI